MIRVESKVIFDTQQVQGQPGLYESLPKYTRKISPLRITCETSALRILRQESYKFKTSLGYRKTLFPKRNPKSYKPVGEAGSTHKTR